MAGFPLLNLPVGLGLLVAVLVIAGLIWIMSRTAAFWVFLVGVILLLLWGSYSVVSNASPANAGGGGATPTAAVPNQNRDGGQGDQGQGSGGEQPPPADNKTPYNLPPQPQIGHPSLYLETGVPCLQGEQNVTCRPEAENTKRWTIQLLPGTVAIIGGFKVDGETSGVYKAQASGTLNTLVTDGFVAITKADWGNAEFCFRVGQARGFKWAPFHVNAQGQPVFTEAQQRARIRPLQGWSGC